MPAAFSTASDSLERRELLHRRALELGDVEALAALRAVVVEEIGLGQLVGDVEDVLRRLSVAARGAVSGSRAAPAATRTSAPMPPPWWVSLPRSMLTLSPSLAFAAFAFRSGIDVCFVMVDFVGRVLGGCGWSAGLCLSALAPAANRARKSGGVGPVTRLIVDGGVELTLCFGTPASQVDRFSPGDRPSRFATDPARSARGVWSRFPSASARPSSGPKDGLALDPASVRLCRCRLRLRILPVPTDSCDSHARFSRRFFRRLRRVVLADCMQNGPTGGKRDRAYACAQPCQEPAFGAGTRAP